MKKCRFNKIKNALDDRDTRQRGVIQTMRKDRGIRSLNSMIAIAVVVMGVSLVLVQTVGAVSYTITVTQTSYGTISPRHQGRSAGTDQAFIITPNAGYAIATLTVDNVSVQPAKAYKFTKVGGPHSIRATFALDTDGDGIPDNVETPGGITLWGKTYSPCTQNVSRYG